MTPTLSCVLFPLVPTLTSAIVSVGWAGEYFEAKGVVARSDSHALAAVPLLASPAPLAADGRR